MRCWAGAPGMSKRHKLRGMCSPCLGHPPPRRVWTSAYVERGVPAWYSCGSAPCSSAPARHCSALVLAVWTRQRPRRASLAQAAVRRWGRGHCWHGVWRASLPLLLSPLTATAAAALQQPQPQEAKQQALRQAAAAALLQQTKQPRGPSPVTAKRLRALLGTAAAVALPQPLHLAVRTSSNNHARPQFGLPTAASQMRRCFRCCWRRMTLVPLRSPPVSPFRTSLLARCCVKDLDALRVLAPEMHGWGGACT